MADIPVALSLSDRYIDLINNGDTAMYKIIDNRTGQIVSVHSTLKQAHRKADRLDLQYGAVRYIVRPMNATITFTPKETP